MHKGSITSKDPAQAQSQAKANDILGITAQVLHGKCCNSVTAAAYDG